MQPLKKYFTEGLIQVAIVLSLAGMHVDVGPYLSPSTINIQSPDIIQTQSSNLHNLPQEYGLHLKCLDVEAPVPRLLHWVRSIKHHHIPTAQLEAWLVHSESDNNGMTIPNLTGAWDSGDELVDMEDSASLTTRMGGGGMEELGYNPERDDGDFEVATTLLRSRMDNEGITENGDEFSLHQQELNQNIHLDQLLQGQNQYLSLSNEDHETGFIRNDWQHGNPFDNPVSSMRQDVQFPGLQEGNSLSTEDCLQLLEAGVSFRNGQYLENPDPVRVDEDPLQHHDSLYFPLVSQQEPVLDLEEQWQDVLAVLGPQDITLDDRLDSFSTRTLENPFQQNHSNDQVTFSRLSQIPYESNTANENFNNPDIIDFLLSPTPDCSNVSMPDFPIEEPEQSSLFGLLLEEPILDENGVLDQASENRSGQSDVLQQENQTDSDSGLSLDYSQSPVSPSISESSSCSSSSSSSSSSWLSTYSTPEEGAVGYACIKEEPMDEEGAVGGYPREENKMCYTNYLQFQYSPWLEHIDHDHTYNQPQLTNRKKNSKEYSDESLEYKLQGKLSTRDEKRACGMKIPFSTDHIVNLPVEEFNKLLANHRLSVAQLTLIRDIRRRGKNKVAAQNCRRRKLGILQDLECSVDGLRCHRARLLREKSDVLRSVREMKQRLNDLYQEVRSRLEEVERIPCMAMDFTMQPAEDDHASTSRRKSGKKQNDKE